MSTAARYPLQLRLPVTPLQLLRGIPEISAEAAGLYRIVWGACLFISLSWHGPTPPFPFPRDQHRPASRLADWEVVHSLASNPDQLAVVRALTLGAIVLFALGFRTRLSYFVAVVGITLHVLVHLQYSQAHQWGLPLVTMWGLLLVPWGDALSVDRALRRRRGLADTISRGGTLYGFALWWPGLTLGVALAAAAFAKLYYSGPRWITGGAVKYHFVQDATLAPVDWGLWVASQHWLAVLLSFLAVVLEAVFILNVFARSSRVRAVFGLVGLSMLATFYVFQGLFWFPWWTLLLAFLPWERLYRWIDPQFRLFAAAFGRKPGPRSQAGEAIPMLTREGGDSAWPPVASHPGPTMQREVGLAHVLLVAFFILQQPVMSVRRIEAEPLFSNYPMYMDTYESTDVFDRRFAQRMGRYYFEVEDQALGFVDETEYIRDLPRGASAILDPLEILSQGNRVISNEVRTRMEEVRAAYAAGRGKPLERVRIYLDQQAFDWEKGRFYWKALHADLGTLDTRSISWTPPSGS